MKKILLILILSLILFIVFKNLNKICESLEKSVEEPKILNLILYSTTIPEYVMMYKILSEYLKKTRIMYYFYTYDNQLNDDYQIKDDIIYIKGEESLVPGCLDKTLKAFSICKNLNFDYIIRSNISEVINFKLLKNYLKNNNVEYGGSILLHLEWLDHIMGIVNEKYWGTDYVMGNAIIFNRNIFNLIESNKDEILSYNVIDDVAFGVFLKNKIKNITHINSNSEEKYGDNIIFYRNRHNDRNVDVENMKQITNKIKI